MAPILERVLELAAGDRADHLDAECSGNPALRADVERLLAVATGAPLWIDEVAFDRFDALLHDVQRAADAPDDDAIGRQIGPFRLLSEIGRGGMGVVYRAERSDAQFRQQVALKLIKRGMDTDFVVRRFRAERQILASLAHPNIARLLDGGTTDDGRPYFVMEYIEGEPIDRYARTHALPLTARLELFLQVCDAVGYAHQQLVVHRDLKPLNILVTPGGVPKLLDFGIARILQDEGDGATGTGVRALTPAYASPEQLEGLRPATASDVYSLGVVLYELLTGSLPHAVRSRSPDDMAQAIRTTEPPRPSAVATALPGRLQRGLRGDLDNIVLMALRKEPQRRYASVEQLAADIRRHLAGMPVMARTDTFRYRAGKYVRRNVAAVTAAAAVALLLVMGSAAVAWQARIATQNAERANRRFGQLRTLARSVLFDYHDAVVDLPGSTPVRERFVKDGLEYLDKLSAEASDDPSLQQELAAAYERMGDVQGGTLVASLGNTSGAIVSYRKALSILEPLLRSDSTNIGTQGAIARVSRDLGMLLWETGDPQQALVRTRQSLRVLESVARQNPAQEDLRLRLHQSHDYLGMVLAGVGDNTGARREYQAALAAIDSMPAAERRGAPARRGYSVTTEHLGMLLFDMAELPAALDNVRRSLALRRELAAEQPLNADLQRAVTVALYNQGEILAAMGRTADAEASYREDVVLTKALRRADPANETYHGDLAYAQLRVGDMLVKRGREREALEHYRESRGIRAKDVAADSTNLWKRSSLIEAHAKIAQTVARWGGEGDAAVMLRETVSLMERTTVDSTDAVIRSFFAETYSGLASGYVDLVRRRVGNAAAACRQAPPLFQRAVALWGDMVAKGTASATDSAKLAATVGAQSAALGVCRSAR
ncbi:MAG: serine/threonine protein kinase [Gemmatimonadetes bacterium]|nr:serine/threonine protein kinase [Gemmatimonadota bacterium]